MAASREALTGVCQRNARLDWAQHSVPRPDVQVGAVDKGTEGASHSQLVRLKIQASSLREEVPDANLTAQPIERKAGDFVPLLEQA